MSQQHSENSSNEDSTNDKGSPSTILGDFNEEKCLKLILDPEFIENLTVMKQKSGSTNFAST